MFQVLETLEFVAKGRELRFKEAWLMPGDKINVVGRASVRPDPTGQRDSLRSTPVRRSLSGTTEEPVVITDADDDVVK